MAQITVTSVDLSGFTHPILCDQRTWVVDQKRFLERVAELEGAAFGEGAFAGGPAVWVGKREVAHFDADGALDLRLTRQVIRARRPELSSDDRVALRKNTSDWLSLKIRTKADEEFALSLAGVAIAANLPSAEPGLPPSGGELARRRRFH